MENNRCTECGIEFEAKRKDAKFCSSKCRKDASRKASIVTDNVTLSDISVTDKFEFTTQYSRTPKDKGYDADIAQASRKPRTALYWYDVPIDAVPVLKEGWPELPNFGTEKEPQYMNGRQYFLWWKNEFKTTKAGPELNNPFPKYDKLEYVNAGEGSRRWGAA